MKEGCLSIEGTYNILLMSRFLTVLRNQFRNINIAQSAQQVHKNGIGKKLLNETSPKGF